jgi:hypothetical protein
MLLYSELATEYSIHGNPDKAEETLLRKLDEFHGDVRSKLELAALYLFSDPESERAVRACLDAQQFARASGKFYREACGVKARLALASARYELLREAVVEIIEHGVALGTIDVGVERDFIDRAPEGAIDSELKASYDALYESYWRRPKS